MKGEFAILVQSLDLGKEDYYREFNIGTGRLERIITFIQSHEAVDFAEEHLVSSGKDWTIIDVPSDIDESECMIYGEETN